MIQMLSLCFYLLSMHPLHMGVIHLDIDENKMVKIEARVFKNDLESALGHYKHADFILDYNDKKSVQLATDYIIHNLQIYSGEKLVAVKFLSIEREKDVAVFTFQATLAEMKSLKVCCEVFQELFSDQTNLLIVKSPQNEEGYRLDHAKKCVVVEI